MRRLKRQNSGQALVEFVIILPIIMMILFIIIDFANIFYQKNHLENVTNDVVKVKQEDFDAYKSKIKNEKIDISYNINGNTLTVKTKKDVDLVTPFANMFFKNPYPIKTERTVIYE